MNNVRKCRLLMVWMNTVHTSRKLVQRLYQHCLVRGWPLAWADIGCAVDCDLPVRRGAYGAMTVRAEAGYLLLIWVSNGRDR